MKDTALAKSGDRYRIVRRVGAGGCGIVYEALDTVRNEAVALKTLARLDASALYRFKKEFRALADVSHPNLVQLYDLSAGDDEWFFTMELVVGVDFLTWVRGRLEVSVGERTEATESHETLIQRDPISGPLDSVPSIPSIPSLRFAVDHGALRDALRQLVTGICALHDAGMLHRDIKPSNVMVTHDGRVVVLDFGIVADIEGVASRITDVDAVVGTPAYMAPEQGAGLPLGPPVDWYAIGIVLYEALAGKLPFEGNPLQILSDKQRAEPPSPRESSPDVPEDLASLCVDLLRRDPAARPTGAEILRRLGEERPSGRHSAVTSRTSQGNHALLLGREDAMRTLGHAFADSRSGGPVATFVHGASGMGKSALIRRFLDTVDHRAVVLLGRCYERESIPYKAFDAVIDALSRWLSTIPPEEAAALVPRDATALARLFPVLTRVPSIANAPRRAIPDPQQLRSRAFSALRELLARIADTRPLVVAIDDLQWGDHDSAALLMELCAVPDAPSCLFVIGHRDGDEGISKSVRRSIEERADLVRVRDISLEPLDTKGARALAALLIGDDTLRDHPVIDAIARESGGSPYNVGELVRYVQADVGRISAGGLRIDSALQQRIANLPEDAARLLLVIAHAGKPIVPEAAYAAASIKGAEAVHALSLLRVAYLVKSAVTRTQRTVECYHDRVRETVLAETTEEDARAVHADIAQALTASGENDPEGLLLHFQAAGMTARALEHAQTAAEKAERVLAFDRAAEFYRTALDLVDGEPARELRVQLGDALAHAGRGAEAAAEYLIAVPGGTGAEQLELRRRAAEQLLVSGRIDPGIREIDAVLARVGMRLPATPVRALLTLVFLRFLLVMRGYRFVARDSSTVPASDLSRIDLYRSLAFGLGAVDNIRGAAFQTRHLLLCMQTGEPTRLARALNVEVTFLAIQGEKTSATVERVLDVSRQLARTVQRPEVEAPLELAETGATYFTGRFRAARLHADRAIEIIREKTSGMHWELDNIEFFNVCAMTYLGELDGLRRRVPLLLREAEERGDLFLGTNLRVGDSALLWLANGDAAEGRRGIGDTMARWSHRSFHVQHSYEAHSLCQLDLYEGNALAAFRRADETWPKLRRAMQARIQLSRVKLFFVRGRAAILAAEHAPEGAAAMLAKAAADARRLEGEARWCRGFASIVRAGIASRRGDRDEAVRIWTRAEAELAQADLAMHAAAVRQVLGTAMGGDRGAELVTRGLGWMKEAAVRDPESMIRMLVPR